MRQVVASNRNLAHLAWAYGFASAIEHDPAVTRSGTAAEHQKMMADAFEAYIGATIRSASDALRVPELQEYTRQLLSPTCAIDLEPLAADLRKRRISRETETAPAAPPAGGGNDQPQPSTGPGRALMGTPDPAALAGFSWSQTQQGGCWEVQLCFGGRALLTVRAVKRAECVNRAVAAFLERLNEDPATISHFSSVIAE